jgi:hypothetical protein
MLPEGLKDTINKLSRHCQAICGNDAAQCQCLVDFIPVTFFLGQRWWPPVVS